MDDDFAELIDEIMKKHPGPWRQKDGYGDRGGRFTSIVDANHKDVFDGEFGHLPELIANLLLNFPELVEQIRRR